MLSHPALVACDDAGNAQSETLFAQQGVASVATAERLDLALVREVSNQHLLWVARPVVLHTPWTTTRSEHIRASLSFLTFTNIGEQNNFPRKLSSKSTSTLKVHSSRQDWEVYPHPFTLEELQSN